MERVVQKNGVCATVNQRFNRACARKEYIMRKKLSLSALVLCAALGASPALAGGIPTFDGAQAANAVAQLNQMAQQLSTLKSQLQQQVAQLENMVMNSIAPATYLWSEADQTVQKIMALQDQLNSSNLQSYLDKYKDLNYYKNNPSNSEIAEIYKTQIEEDRKAQQNLATAISQQQEKLNEEATRLRNLNTNSGTAQGHLEALQYANQYASLQNDQLMQMRALMMQQAAAENARAQMENDEKARVQAFREKALEDKWKKSSGSSLSFD